MTNQEPATVIAVRSSFGKAQGMVPAGIDAKRLTQAFIAYIESDPKLLACSPASIRDSYFDCARLGLWPGPQGHMYVLPYGKKATPIPGYKGLLVLAKRGGTIHKIEARVVRENDEFAYKLGIAPDLQHVPKMSDRGDPTHAYAVAFFFKGEPQFIVMERDEIEQIRDGVTRWQDGPWNNNPGEMWKKTAIRRLCKVVGTDEVMAHAFSLEDTELGPQGSRPVPVIAQAPPSLMDRAIRYSDQTVVIHKASPVGPTEAWDGAPLDPGPPPAGVAFGGSDLDGRVDVHGDPPAISDDEQARIEQMEYEEAQQS